MSGRDVLSCAAGLLLVAAIVVALGYSGVLEGWFVAAYGGP